MNLNLLFQAYLEIYPPSAELSEEVYLRVARVIALSEGASPPVHLNELGRGDRRLDPYEDAPSIVLSKLQELRQQGTKLLPVAAIVLVLRAKVDSYRRWAKQNSRQIGFVNQVELVADIASAGLAEELEGALIGRLLEDIAEFISTWEMPERRFLAYCCIPRLQTRFARLAIQYGVRTSAQIADEIGTSEAQLTALMEFQGPLVQHLSAILGKPPSTMDSAARRIVRAIRLFAERLPYIVELCDLIKR